MEKLAKDEYEKAGPTLGKFYNKLIRLNSSNGINIIQENEGISLMDDVNMLAFMDLLKYQMSSKATMEQLFFITCDDRISKLLKYKLSGRGIGFCELLEADFM